MEYAGYVALVLSCAGNISMIFDLRRNASPSWYYLFLHLASAICNVVFGIHIVIESEMNLAIPILVSNAISISSSTVIMTHKYNYNH